MWWAASIIAVGFSCHGEGESEQLGAVARIAPVKVSNADAWRLFDRSTTSGYTPTSDVITIELDRPEQLAAVKVRGASPYILEVRGENGVNLGLPAYDLSSLDPGWQILRAPANSSTKTLQLRFRAAGTPTTLPELELWAAQSASAKSDDISFTAAEKSTELAPGDCASFLVAIDRAPATFARVELDYESVGIYRPFVVERSINGRTAIGGSWISIGADSTSRTLSEQIDPATLERGTNEVNICVPIAADRGVTISNLRFVARLDRGIDLATEATLPGQRDADALVDENANTSVSIGAGERVVLDFDRLIAPDALIAHPDATPTSVECITKNGAALTVEITDVSDATRLDGGAKACRALAVTFASAVTLDKLDVIGSGAQDAVDWPHIVVTSPREHFGAKAWVAGYVARPPVLNGAIRTEVAGHASDTNTGDFGRLVERTATIGDWKVDVSAELPDSTQQIQTVLLAHDQTSDLRDAQGAGTSATNPNDKRFGKTGDSAVGQATPTASTKIRLGTNVGLDIPVGAVDKPTTIKANHLSTDKLPPLDPGMINVTAPKDHGYEFLPHGQRFAKTIEVIVPFDTKLIPQGKTVDDVHTYYFDTNARGWKKLQRRAIDLGDRTMRSATDHFTIMINAVLTTPSNPKPLSFDPTSMSSLPAASPAANVDFVQAPTPNSAGDARMSLPIRIPPGRGVYTPELALTYSSSAANGWLGVGWDLPTSKIEIDTRWGVPTYAQTEEPRYVIDGSQIVPTTDTDGPTCTNGKRYHYRVEGSFSHILRCGAWPNYYWQVRDRDGTLYTYGDTAGSVLANPQSGSIYRWNLREVADVYGNKTTYTYFLDNIAGNANGSEPARDSYLDTIAYTQHATLAAKYQVKLIRDDGTRTDRQVNGRPGFKVVTRHLLRAIRVIYDPGSSPSTVREYVLTYGPGQFGKTVLKTVRLYGTGGCAASLSAFNAPSCSGASFFNEHKFDYYSGLDNLVGFGNPTQWSVVGDPDASHSAISKGESDATSATISIGAKGGSVNASASATGTSGERKELVGFYDVNGDGLPDHVIDNGSGLTVLYNQFGDYGNKSFSTVGPALSGLATLGHESHMSWSVDASAGIESGGFGASAQGGYSSSKAASDQMLTDFDGDGFLDQIAMFGPMLSSAPCPTGHCFNTATFDATSLIDPTQDSMLMQTAAEASERLVLGDPVVQWVAPYTGTITVVATAQKRRAGGTDGVTFELYQQVVGASPAQDTLLASASIPATDTTSHTLTQTAISVTAGQAFYIRLKTGNPDIAANGTLNDEVDTGIGATYLTACNGGTCAAVTNPLGPKDPAGNYIYHFPISSAPVTATRPFQLPARGTLRARGRLHRAFAIQLPFRACLQRYPGGTEQFDVPCGNPSIDLTPIINITTYLDQYFDITTNVELGDSLVMRVEADSTFNPGDLILLPHTAGEENLIYTQVCLPSASGTTCTSDPAQIALVGLDTSTFGAFAAPVSPPSPPGAVPLSLVVPATGSWQIDYFLNPLYPTPIKVTVRVDSQLFSGYGPNAVIGSFSCTLRCGTSNKFGTFPPMPEFSVYAGDSITFDITATNTSAAPVGWTLPGYFGNTYAAPVVWRNKVPTPKARTPFVGGHRGYRVTFWNEKEAFEPSRLLEDYAQLGIAPGTISDARRKQMMRSAVEPVGYQNTQQGFPIPPPVYPLTYPDPAWGSPGSAAFITSWGRANAAELGVMQRDARSVGGSAVNGSYARLSVGRSYYVGIGAETGTELQSVGLSASLNASVSNGDSTTTTDVIDVTGDGIADVIAGDQMFVSTLVNGAVLTYGGLGLGGGFRRRTSHDYSFGFGQCGSTHETSAGGRTLSMQSPCKAEGTTVSGSGKEGISIGRSQTTTDLIDVNGDGLPDVVERVGNEIRVRYNLGNRFDQPEVFGIVDSDLDGNCQQDPQRCIDSFQTFEDSTSVLGFNVFKSNDKALSHETSISQNITFTIDLLFASASFTLKGSSSRTTRQLADINGDGLPDLLLKKGSDPDIHVQYNLGGTFAPASEWTNPPWGPPMFSVFPEFVTNAFGDLFGTGSKAVTGPDVLASTGTQDSYSYSGSVSIPIAGIVSLGFGAGGSHEKDTYELGLVDVNGDGSPDHVLRRGESNDPQYMYVKPNLQDGRSNLLKKVTGPLGGEISLEYTLVGPSIDMPHGRQTLSKVTVDDRSPSALEPTYASPNLVVSYYYGEGYYDRLEKEFFGFKHVQQLRHENGLDHSVLQTYENRDYTLHGQMSREQRWAVSGPTGAYVYDHVITRSVRSVEDASNVALGAHSDCTNNLHALLRRLNDAPCLTKYSVITKDEETRYEWASTKTRTIEDLVFDRFGNIKESLDRADAELGTSDDVYTVATYKNDTTAWILGRPLTLEVHKTTASGDLLRSRSATYTSSGQIEQLDVATGTATPALASTNFTYDVYGNLETLTTPANESGDRQKYTLTYDTGVKTYVTNTRDEFQYQSQASFDLRFGVETTTTDITGASIVRTLDAFGRLATVKGPYDVATGDGMTMTYLQGESPPRAITVTKASKAPTTVGTVANAITTEMITNGLGEPIQVRKTGVVDTGTVAVKGVITSGLVERDVLGRVTKRFQPFFTEGTSTGFIVPPSVPKAVSTQYDHHDRPTVTTYPDGATETVSYSIQNSSSNQSMFRVQTTDTDGHQRETFADFSGHTLEVVEHPNASSLITKYEYAPTGELTKIIDDKNNTTYLDYDKRGLRTSLRNPDTGEIKDTYDAMGNRITTQEPNHRAKGVSIQFKYNRDRLERVIYPSKPAIRTCADGQTASVCYEYGAASATDPLSRGRLVKVQDESGNQVHTYGSLGEIIRTVRTVAPPTVAPVVFEHRYGWDSMGRLLSIRYPDGETVINTYDDAGNLKQVDGLTFTRNYARDIRYDVFGNRTHLEYGNHVTSTWAYDYNRVRLAGITTQLPTSNRKIQALEYTYTNNGHGRNFAGIENRLQDLDNNDPTNMPGKSSLSFTYDGIDRLLTVRATAELNAQKSKAYDEDFIYSPDPSAPTIAPYNVLSKKRVSSEYQTDNPINPSYMVDEQVDRCSTPPCNPAGYSYNATWASAIELDSNGQPLPLSCIGESGSRPHLPTQFGALNQGITLQYDCSGNPITRQKSGANDTQKLWWDDDGRLIKMQSSNATQENTYDAAGRRVRRASGGGQNNVTLYPSVYFDLDGNTQGMRHVFAGNLRIATELSSFASSASPPAPTGEQTRYFFHADHLGSTAVVTDASVTNPQVAQSIEYYADGEEWFERASNATTEYLFNGKTYDTDTGFYDFGQRFYDPRTGLWLGVDPAVRGTPNQIVGQPGFLSVLSFGANNPVRFGDPDGRAPWDREKPANPYEPAVVRDMRETMDPAKQIERVANNPTVQRVAAITEAVTGAGAEAGQDMVPIYGTYRHFKRGEYFWGTVSAISDLLLLAKGAKILVVGAEVLEETQAVRSGIRAERAAAKAAREGAINRIGETPIGLRTAEERAKEVHKELGWFAQKFRTTAVVETAEGVRVVASSTRRLSKAQRAALAAGEIEGIGQGHAEFTAISNAIEHGLTPIAVGASRPICASCAEYIQELGVAASTVLKEYSK